MSRKMLLLQLVLLIVGTRSEDDCSSESEVQALERELEETKERLEELEKRMSLDVDGMLRNVKDVVVSTSKFISNPSRQDIIETTQAVLIKFTFTWNWLRSRIVELLQSSDVMSKVEVEFVVDTIMYFITFFVCIVISQKIFALCCSSSTSSSSGSNKTRKKKKKRKSRKKR
jgi:hypothetical protein